MRQFRLAAVLIAMAAPAAVSAAGEPEPATMAVALISRVGEDGAIALADGRTLSLAEIELPRGRDGRESREAIKELAGDGAITLQSDGPDEDRYGRIVAQAYAADGEWLQGELIRRGLARVATTPDHRERARDLLAIERAAISHRVGLWARPEYALRTPDEAARLVDTWQVVEGTVAEARTGHNEFYLEFGADRARDLAVRIPNWVAKEMDVDPAMLTGRRLRVRGWIGKTIGPVIAVNHAEQIELLGRRRRMAVE